MGNTSVDAEVKEETVIYKNETPKALTEKPETFKAFDEHQQKSKEENGPKRSLIVYGVPGYFPPGKKHYINGCSMFGQSSSSSDSSDSEDSNSEESDDESINLGDSETKQDETPAEPKDKRLDLDSPKPRCGFLVYGVPGYFPPEKKHYLIGCSMFGQSSSSSDSSDSKGSTIEESDDDSINSGDSETKLNETLAEPKNKRLDLDVGSAAKTNKPTEYLVKHGTKRLTEDVNKDSKRAKEMASQTEDVGKKKTEGIGNESTDDENTDGTKYLKV